MKRISLFCICLITIAHLNAQIPSGYYDNAENLNGYTLKTALHNIINNHSDKGYSAIWGFIINNDKDLYYENDGTILDIYSENPTGDDAYNFTPSTNQCGNYSVEGDCYNREHSFPKSWFDDKSPMYSDVHHLFPTDGKVNSYRGSYPFGNVGSASITSQNGSKRGSGTSELGYSGTVFEPIDEFKGDLARAHFYMATRYEDIIAGWQSNSSSANAVLDGSKARVFEEWALDLLYSWHKNDPVSSKEIARNNAANTFQGNRNPYVDRPEFIDSVWFPNGATTPPIDPPSGDTCIKSLFPSPNDNPIWYEVEFTNTDTINFTSHNFQIYRLIGDTTIESKVYSRLFLFNDPNDHISLASYIGALRTDTCSSVYYIPENDNEYLLYDFSKNIGDTIFSDFLKDDLYIDYYKVTHVDSIEIDDFGFRKRISVTSKEGNATWIEGIGSLKGLLWPVLPSYYYLSSKHPVESNYGRLLICNNYQNKSAYQYWVNDCYYENSSLLNDVASLTQEIQIYPQPASTVLQIDLGMIKDADIAIYNSMGQLVTNHSNASGELELNVELWPSGLYFGRVVLKQNGSLVTIPILVK